MSRVRLFPAGVLAAAAMLLLPAPAAAHDQLIESSPSVGQRLETAPASVSLEFSGELLALDGAGATVLVMDGDGDDWIEGEPLVDGRTVTAALRAGMPEAGYELRWRVVSSDGHPISGVVPFTVGDAEPLRQARPAEPGAGDTDAQEARDQIDQQDRRPLRAVLIGAGGAAFAVALLALLRFLRRRGGPVIPRPRTPTGNSPERQDP